ncbi:MAG TPA: hypothetical protein ACFCUY_09135 [Xenococcaceae cyanobacterium]
MAIKLFSQAAILTVAIAIVTLVNTSKAEIPTNKPQVSQTAVSSPLPRELSESNRPSLRRLFNWRILIPKREITIPSEVSCQQSHRTHQSSSTNISGTTVAQSRSVSTITTCHN